MIKHASVSVGTSATSLLGTVSDGTAHVDDVARSVVLTNTGASSVFVGGSTVTTSSYGFELKAGATLALDLLDSDVPFGVVASGTVAVVALHVGA